METTPPAKSDVFEHSSAIMAAQKNEKAAVSKGNSPPPLHTASTRRSCGKQCVGSAIEFYGLFGARFSSDLNDERHHGHFHGHKTSGLALLWALLIETGMDTDVSPRPSDPPQVPKGLI